MLASVLWGLLGEHQVQSLSKDGSSGHVFEDLTVEKVYAACHRLGTLKSFPPRYTLRLPTVSGLYHQIDVVVREGSSSYHLIECKFEQLTDVAELYAFNGKLLDYSLGAQARHQKTRLRAYFLTASPTVSESFYKYALAWGITVIAPGCLPPPEHMLAKIEPNTTLHRQLTRLVDRTTCISLGELVAKPREADKLLADWRSHYQSWRRAGYGA